MNINNLEASQDMLSGKMDVLNMNALPGQIIGLATWNCVISDKLLGYLKPQFPHL